MIKRLAITIAAAMVSATLLSAGLPSVGNGTEPNVWTKNMEGVLAAAKETGYPILLVMINDSATGEGCSHCWNFVQSTLNNPEFDRIVKTYPFYMVLINFWPGAPGWVSEDYFLNYFFKYASRETFPLVATLKSNGSIDYNAWSQPNTEARLFYKKIEERLSAMVKKSTVLNLSATLDEVSSDSCWTGTVTRTGSSGSTGSVTISLSGANAANYTVSPASISWGSAVRAVAFREVTYPTALRPRRCSLKILGSQRRFPSLHPQILGLTNWLQVPALSGMFPRPMTAMCSRSV